VEAQGIVELPLEPGGPACSCCCWGWFFICSAIAPAAALSIIGLFLGIYGLTGMAWGPEWMRKTVFPFVLFVFSIPLGTMVLPITFQLRMLVCDIVEAICHAITVDIVRDGTQFADPGNHYGYEVAAAGSGIRSLIATVCWRRFMPCSDSRSGGSARC